MAVLQTHVCDRPDREPHEPTQTVSAKIGRTAFLGEFCDDCANDVARALTQLGLKPTRAQVGHSRRGAYITASGRTYTASEARRWLKDAGHNVADAGKLTTEHLEMYAANH